MDEFLHSHPAIELGLKLSTEHVIIERKDWEAAKNMLQTDRVGKTTQSVSDIERMWYDAKPRVEPPNWRDFGFACTFGTPQPVYKPPTLKPWKVTVRLKPEQRFNGKFICTVNGELREVPEPFISIHATSYPDALKIFNESEIIALKIEKG